MDGKKVAIALAGLGGGVFAGAVLRKKMTEKEPEEGTEPEEQKEPEIYHGVPLAELTELAKQIYHGLCCTVDPDGLLVFHYRETGGEEIEAHMASDENGKLLSLAGHRVGQLWSGVDEFVKLANERYTFIG